MQPSPGTGNSDAGLGCSLHMPGSTLRVSDGEAAAQLLGLCTSNNRAHFQKPVGRTGCFLVASITKIWPSSLLCTLRSVPLGFFQLHLSWRVGGSHHRWACRSSFWGSWDQKSTRAATLPQETLLPHKQRGSRELGAVSKEPGICPTCHPAEIPPKHYF